MISWISDEDNSPVVYIGDVQGKYDRMLSFEFIRLLNSVVVRNDQWRYESVQYSHI